MIVPTICDVLIIMFVYLFLAWIVPDIEKEDSE